jgi:hypothetical protein
LLLITELKLDSVLQYIPILSSEEGHGDLGHSQGESGDLLVFGRRTLLVGILMSHGYYTIAEYRQQYVRFLDDFMLEEFFVDTLLC